MEQEGAERDAGPEADAEQEERGERDAGGGPGGRDDLLGDGRQQPQLGGTEVDRRYGADLGGIPRPRRHHLAPRRKVDRKSTRLNSSHLVISYAVFCLKKKNK